MPSPRTFGTSSAWWNGSPRLTTPFSPSSKVVSVSWDGTAVDMGLFRDPTPGARYDDATIFPGVMRNLDRAVIHLSQAIGNLMTPVREDGRHRCEATSMRSPRAEPACSGCGAGSRRTSSERRHLVGGLALVTSADFTGGAATTFTLPDFDAIVGPTDGSAVGFRMPVPRGLARATDSADALRVFGVARDGRACELQRG